MDASQETRPQEGKRGKGIGIPWVLALMAISFTGGVAVGLNPVSVPVPKWVPAGFSWGSNNAAHPRLGQPDMTGPQSPTTQPMTDAPATQP